MDKTKTSHGREKFSPKKLKIKNWDGITKCNPEDTLLDEKLVANAIFECLKENDTEALMEILDSYLSALNRSKFSRDKKIPRSTIYHSLRKRNPTIKTLARIVNATVH